MNLAPGVVISGKYRLERKIASGGQGSVWVARHIQLHAEVAVKFLDTAPSEDGELARIRFEREARAAANIRHPHLVHVQDIGDHEGTPFLVMEFFRGESLDKRLKAQKCLELTTVANLLLPIARGLKRLHDAGFVHRDIKPSNIFLAINDEGEEVLKILDFGIVKALNIATASGTQTGDFVGSPSYMSPEQLRASKHPDVRSDIWSVGVILYQALTGSRPFDAEGVSNIILEILTGSFIPPCQRNPNLPPSLDAFFAKALSRNVAQRFQSITEMAAAFAEIAAVRTSFPSPMPTPLAPTQPNPMLDDDSTSPYLRMRAAIPEPIDEITATPVEDEIDHEDGSDLLATIPLEQARAAALGRPMGGTQKLPSAHEIAQYLPPRPHPPPSHPGAGAMSTPTPSPSQPSHLPHGYGSTAPIPSSQSGGRPQSFPSYPLPMSIDTPQGPHRDRPTPTKPVHNNRWLLNGLLMGIGLGLILVVVLLLVLR